MKIRNYREVAADTEIPGVTLRTVISPEEAPRFSMRVFEVKEGASTPFHAHAWEHEVFILSGQGKVRSREGERALAPNDVVYVAPQEEHCFVNSGKRPFRFICCIPHSSQITPAPPPIACEG